MLPSTKYSTDVCDVMEVYIYKGEWKADIHVAKVNSLLTHGMPTVRKEIRTDQETTLIMMCQAT
jgi:hypothetical protein